MFGRSESIGEYTGKKIVI